MDQRGRIYCSSTYFNYQSNELSKALLLFAIPGVISRHDNESIKYLKAYGANCFGGNISKKSIYDKCVWVDNNTDNIINYENNILINKAQDKLLFLSFCIQYKRYIEFIQNENNSEFKTYLPVQLDASCNGFQHMAMLSNERVLFEELNLVIPKHKKATINNIVSNVKEGEGYIQPKDFYNFILYKVTTKLQKQIDKGIIVDEKTKGNYESLSKFLWSRNMIKKAIMTIPYNASSRSMRTYLKEQLTFHSEEGKLEWFTDGTNNTNKVNNHDISLLISIISTIIFDDCQKIKKLTKYLQNVAKLVNIFNKQVEECNTENTTDSYQRLRYFYIERSNIKKAIMTIPYNACSQNMRKYIEDNLYLVEEESNKKILWYSKSDKLIKPWINNKDISLLVNCIQSIIRNDFEKI